MRAAPMGRRLFLRRAGAAAFGMIVLSPVAACSGTRGDGDQAAVQRGPTAAGSPSAGGSPAPTSNPFVTASQPPATAPPVQWHRIDRGVVSAYILYRDGEAALVDTGVRGTADGIERALGEVGLGWDVVRHVIFTHYHPDHAGSSEDVLERAADAEAYAGESDIPAIRAPRDLTPVTDGDEVFGLRIITTPGHTAGHIVVLDPAGPGLLVAGDALVGDNGRVAGPDPRYTSNMDLAKLSVVKLANLRFETVVFGHGDPVERGASEQVAELAATL